MPVPIAVVCAAVCEHVGRRDEGTGAEAGGDLVGHGIEAGRRGAHARRVVGGGRREVVHGAGAEGIVARPGLLPLQGIGVEHGSWREAAGASGESRVWAGGRRGSSADGKSGGRSVGEKEARSGAKQ